MRFSRESCGHKNDNFIYLKLSIDKNKNGNADTSAKWVEKEKFVVLRFEEEQSSFPKVECTVGTRNLGRKKRE